jgi:hypothetical protein
MVDGSCTVLVCSCDKYADLLAPFMELWRKFWPDCPFKTVLVTESVPDVDGFDNVIACGGGLSWCSRLLRALDEITTPYVLMLCDDYYLETKVDTNLVLQRLSQMRQFNASNLRMIPNPKPTSANALPFEGGLMRYKTPYAYSVATQAGLWERSFLKLLAQGRSSIWEFERYGSFDERINKHLLLVTPTKEFPFVDAVHKGYWESWGVSLCVNNGIDISKLKRTLPPFKVRLREGLKALVFHIVPWNWIVRFQNAFGAGAKESAKVSV